MLRGQKGCSEDKGDAQKTKGLLRGQRGCSEDKGVAQRTKGMLTCASEVLKSSI